MKADLPFPEVRRYIKTLKEELAAGKVFEHHDGRSVVANMRMRDGWVVMKGFSGEHRIWFDACDDARIKAHWKGFCEIVDQARANLKRGRSR